MTTLLLGNCLDLMCGIPDGSVDMVLADLPYGTTHCKWDTVIPFPPLWEQYERVIKDNGAILLFSAQPFTTDLITSNRALFRYEIIWEKTQKTGFFNAKKMPLRAHENICVFYKKLPTYNPQMQTLSEEYIKEHLVPLGRTRRNSDFKKTNGGAFGKVSKQKAEKWAYTDDGTRFPTDVIKFSNWNGTLFGKGQGNKAVHPTRKPTAILEYLIRTYTNEGETVLDNTMGSGSTGVACVNTRRNFIGMELELNYFNIAQERIREAQERAEIEDAQLSIFTKNGGDHDA